MASFDVGVLVARCECEGLDDEDQARRGHAGAVFCRSTPGDARPRRVCGSGGPPPGTRPEREELDIAVACAKDVTGEYGQPIRPDLAVRFLPLVAVQRPEAYDAWALRWLARWSTESAGATIDVAAQIAAALADLPAEPSALNTLRQATPTA